MKKLAADFCLPLQTVTSPIYVMSLERHMSPYPLTEGSEHYPVSDLGFSEVKCQGLLLKE